MAERLVTHAFRDSNGVIHAVGNPASDWFRRRREWAIGDIVAGRHSYVVQSGQGTRPLRFAHCPRLERRVVNGPSGPYQGQVLMFGGNEHDPGNAVSGDVHNTRIYEVHGNEVIASGSPEAEVFCGEHAYLPDGRAVTCSDCVCSPMVG
jgi:hypothetical protein